jgi:hypothetical protein
LNLQILIRSFQQVDKTTDFTKVDKFVLQTPDSVTKDIETLANYLTTSTATPSTEKKFRAIYAWVSQNIHYDEDFDLTSPFTTADVVATQDADRVLEAHKGVCMGFAQLFVALAQAANLKAEMVEGIVRQSDGNIPKIGHAWVAVRLRKKAEKGEKPESHWYLCDPTWAIPTSEAERGKVNDTYFLVEPTEFIKDHLPLDPMWQLLEHPAPVEVFAKESEAALQKYITSPAKKPFMFQDTISRALSMDSTKRIEKSIWRMLYYNPVNDYIWFEVGKVFWRRFLNAGTKIDNIIERSLYANTIVANEEKFEEKLNIFRVYFKAFRNSFANIDDATVTEMMKEYSPQMLEVSCEVYRTNYRVAVLNALLENNDKATPNVSEKIETLNMQIDSMLAKTRSKILTLPDTNQQKMYDLFLTRNEKVACEKNVIYAFNQIEELLFDGNIENKKRMLNNYFKDARRYLRQQQRCMDSIAYWEFGSRQLNIPNPFAEAYTFLLDADACAADAYFITMSLQNQWDTKKSKDLIAYIDPFKTAQTCMTDVVKKGQAQSEEVQKIIEDNHFFLGETNAQINDNLAFLYMGIAIRIWNENLANETLVKQTILDYLRQSEASYDIALVQYQSILSDKKYVAQVEAIIKELKTQKVKLSQFSKEVSEQAGKK